MPVKPHAPILDISLDADSRTPLYRQLYEALRDSILCGRLGPGARLPSSRSLADELAVLRNTVQGALDQLFAEGYLQAKRGSGTFVTDDLPDSRLHVTHRSIRNASPPRPVDRTNEARDVAPSEWAAFRPDYPDISAFPFATWKRLLARNWAQPNPELLGYGDPRGYGPLRVAIANFLDKTRSVVCDPDQIIILPHTQLAISLAAKVLLKQGDAVWFENPGYTRARQAIERADATIVPASVDNDGMNVDRAIATAATARLAYVTPSHQYPLGHLMSLGRRLALLDWANRNGSWILEDDYGTYFRYSGRSRHYDRRPVSRFTRSVPCSVIRSTRHCRSLDGRRLGASLTRRK